MHSFNYKSMRPLIILAALAASSCMGLTPAEPSVTEAVFTLKAGTKATSGMAEYAINHWAVMLFDAGNPDASYYAVSDSGEDITCTVRKDRPYRAYAIVNYPTDGPGAFDPAEVGSEADLNSFVSYLGGNGISSLTMFGSTALPAPSPGTRTPITVSRLCSKVCISKITLSVTDALYSGKDFILNALYLTNVYCAGTLAEDHFTPSDDESLWYNATAWHGSGSIDALDALVGDRGLSERIPDGGSYTRTHTFYAYPNACSQDSRSPVWSPRCTRLVIEATLGNKRYFYPVTISGMQRNHNYTVTEAVIHGPGSLDPEQEIPGVLDISLSITQDTWDSEYYISETS